jgi:parvulin-like peptidyl-prolyl isomerase
MANDLKPNLALGALLLAVTLVPAEDAKLPVVDDRESVASVNGEPVTLEDLRRQIESLHAEVSEIGEMVERPDPSALLERIIDVRLIVQEARIIGLDELPEVTTELRQGRMAILKRMLIDECVKEITEGDPAVTDGLYRDSVREVKIESALFRTEEDATAFGTAVEAGRDFQALAKEMIEQNSATAIAAARYVKAKELFPEVSTVLLDLEVDSISPPIKLPQGFTVVRLIEIRYPDDPEARELAEQQALRVRQEAALAAYTDEMRTSYAKIDREIVDSLDFDSEVEGLERMRNDNRIVAEIMGAEPVTVAELTERVEKKFYHGVKGAIERNRVNSEVYGILDRVILERAALLEAERLGLESTESYRSSRKRLEDRVLFSKFMAKVVNPEIKLEEDELKTYHAEHAGDYTSLETIRLESLAFHARDDAEAALAKLRQGADPKWMRANADGQVDSETDVNALEFNGRERAVVSLPEGVRNVVEGASAGDVRFYADPGGAFYVLLVGEFTPPKPLEYSEVREQIAKILFEVKRQEVIENWLQQLKEASEIEIFVDDEELRAILGLGSMEEA